MKRVACILFGLSLIMMACVDEETMLEFLEHEPGIVIESVITDRAGDSYVQIGQTVPWGADFKSQYDKNALVTLHNGLHQTDTFYHLENGRYMNKDFVGKVNSEYTLKVNCNGKDYTATTRILPVMYIDSAQVDKAHPDVEGYTVKVYGQRISQKHDSHCRVTVKLNDTLLNKDANFLILSDANVSSFNGLYLDGVFQKGDMISIEVYSITPDLYYYFNEIRMHTALNIESMYTYPFNPRTNLSGGALGYFQASAVSSMKIVIL
jgi:hypothetical protein